MRRITGISAELTVEGEQDDGPFAGRVIAVAVDDGDPGSLPSNAATYFLVADDRRSAPLWVSSARVTGQRLGR